MSLIKIMNERLKQQFEDAKVKGANQFAPRDGLYSIISVYYKFVGKLEIPVAQAHWKATLEEPFLSEVTFEIALLSIRCANDEQAVVSYPSLVGLTIRVFESAIICVNEFPLFRCKYVVLTIKSTFWDGMDIVNASL